MPVIRAGPRIRVKNTEAPVMPSQPPLEIEPTTGNASAFWVRQLTNATISTTSTTSTRMPWTQFRTGPTKLGPWAASSISQDYPGGYPITRARPGRRTGLLGGRAGLLGRLDGGRLDGDRLVGGLGAAEHDLLATGDQVGVDGYRLLLGRLDPGHERGRVTPRHTAQPIDVELRHRGLAAQLDHPRRDGLEGLVREVTRARGRVERSRVLPGGLVGGHLVSSCCEATDRAARFAGFFGNSSGVAVGASGADSVASDGSDSSRAFSRRNVSYIWMSDCFCAAVSSGSAAMAARVPCPSLASRASSSPARRYITGVETRRALASCWRTSALGRRRPRSIWLRYGLLTPACSASWRSEMRALWRRSRMNPPMSRDRFWGLGTKSTLPGSANSSKQILIPASVSSTTVPGRYRRPRRRRAAPPRRRAPRAGPARER